MEKIHYEWSIEDEGPIEGAYTDENFYDLMKQLITGQPNSRVLVEGTKKDDPQDETNDFTVNAWTLDGTIILYHAEYISTKVIIYGPDEDSVKSVEEKIDLAKAAYSKKPESLTAD